MRCTSEGKQKRKPGLCPYYSPSDSRFAVSVYISVANEHDYVFLCSG